MLSEKLNLQKHPNLYIVLITISYFILLAAVQLGGNQIRINLFGEETFNWYSVLPTVCLAAILTFIIFVFTNQFFEKIDLKKIEVLEFNLALLKTFLISTAIIFSILYICGFYFYQQTGETKYLLLIFTSPLARLIYMLVPAVLEELIFRGTFLNFFKQKNKTNLGLIITSSIFGVIHLLNALVGNPIDLLGVVSITFAGLLLGLMYLNYGLFSAVLVHYSWNAFGGIAFEGKIFPTLVIAVACMILLVRFKKYHPTK